MSEEERTPWHPNCCKGPQRCWGCDTREIGEWDPTIDPPTQEMIDSAPPGLLDGMTDISWLSRLDMLDTLPASDPLQ